MAAVTQEILDARMMAVEAQIQVYAQTQQVHAQTILELIKKQMADAMDKANEADKKIAEMTIEMNKMMVRIETLETKDRKSDDSRSTESKLNGMKDLQQAMQKYDGSAEAEKQGKGPSFVEWREDVETIIEKVYPGIGKILAECRDKKEDIDEKVYDNIITELDMCEDDLAFMFDEVSREIYTMLRRNTTGDSRAFVESSNGVGVEAYRRLNQNYDPYTSGKAQQVREECTKIGHTRAKNVKEMGRMYRKFVNSVSKYRKTTNTELDAATKSDILMKIVPADVRQHLILANLQEDYPKIRALVEHLVREEDAQQAARAICSLEEDEKVKDDDQVGDDGAANGMGGESVSAFKGQGGKGGPKGGCHVCGGPHYANQCPKAGGKNSGPKGGGKGPKGGCHLCGGPHYQSECPQWGGKGLGTNTKVGGKFMGGFGKFKGGFGKGTYQIQGYPKGKGTWGKGGLYSFGEDDGGHDQPWTEEEPWFTSGIGGIFSSFQQVSRKKSTTRTSPSSSSGDADMPKAVPTHDNTTGMNTHNKYQVLQNEGDEDLDQDVRKVETIDEQGDVKKVEIKKATFADVLIKSKAPKKKARFIENFKQDCPCSTPACSMGHGQREREGERMVNMISGEAMVGGRIALFMEKPAEMKHEIFEFSRPQEEGWKKITATVDSGSTETVTSEEACPGVKTVPSPQSKSGVVYEVANSDIVPNEGQKICDVAAEGMMAPKKMVIQVARVHKTLLSVGRLTRAGNTVVFSEVHGDYIENNFTGERIYMKRTGNLYEVDLWVRTASASGFGRPGM